MARRAKPLPAVEEAPPSKCCCNVFKRASRSRSASTTMARAPGSMATATPSSGHRFKQEVVNTRASDSAPPLERALFFNQLFSSWPASSPQEGSGSRRSLILANQYHAALPGHFSSRILTPALGKQVLLPSASLAQLYLFGSPCSMGTGADQGAPLWCTNASPVMGINTIAANNTARSCPPPVISKIMGRKNKPSTTATVVSIKSNPFAERGVCGCDTIHLSR